MHNSKYFKMTFNLLVSKAHNWKVFEVTEIEMQYIKYFYNDVCDKLIIVLDSLAFLYWGMY